MAKIEILKPFILKWEGGFVNDPDDAGGATNKGITIATFRQFFGSDKTVEDLKNITDAQWQHIFKTGYWDRWQADRINSQGVANVLVDWVWASGKYGITIPQELLRVTADGIVGKKTLSALNGYLNQYELFIRIRDARYRYIDDIIKKRPANAKFRKGWLNRINDIKFE